MSLTSFLHLGEGCSSDLDLNGMENCSLDETQLFKDWWHEGRKWKLDESRKRAGPILNLQMIRRKTEHV